MPLDSRYVTTLSLDEYFPDKNTGAPLAGGKIFFYKDDDRVTAKLVYKLTGAPPNYVYTPLPNPITLNGVGQPVDDLGNNVAIYYFPFDDAGNIELYYVKVTDPTGFILQEERQGWPNTTAANLPQTQEQSSGNSISNGQFINVNFYQNPLTINYNGNAIDTVQIAPDWELIINHTNNGAITVQRNAIAGTAALPGNPPYTLTITPGLNLAALTLRQRLRNNPNIFARAAGGANGYISASILLGGASSIDIYYQPNGQPLQLILAENNVAGQPKEFSSTIQLAPANNPQNADVGYVDIILDLPLGAPTTLSNVQIVGLSSNIEGIPYIQTPVNRETDFLFNYYNIWLQQKAIPSYLIGWDFPLNPGQLGDVFGAVAGANTSRYTWDQTIIFQSVTNSYSVSRGTRKGIQILTAAITQLAFVQYLPIETARQLLKNPLSVNISGESSANVLGTVSIYYTNDGALPNMGANNSLVATIGATGKPATFNGNWNEVTRLGLGDATFTIGAATNGNNPNNYPLQWWDLNGANGITTANFVAIVVGFAAIPNATTMYLESISLVPGRIATIPAPDSETKVLIDCQRYYEKTFLSNIVPAQNAGVGTGEIYITVPSWTRGNTKFTIAKVLFSAEKYRNNSLITFYNPFAADGEAQNINTANAATVGIGTNFNSGASPNRDTVNKKGFTITVTDVTGVTQTGDTISVHWTADSRLGF